MSIIRNLNSARFRQDNSSLVKRIGMWAVLTEATGRLQPGWVILGRCKGGSLGFRPNRDQWAVLFEHNRTGEQVWFHVSEVQLWLLECEQRRKMDAAIARREAESSSLHRRVVSF